MHEAINSKKTKIQASHRFILPAGGFTKSSCQRRLTLAKTRYGEALPVNAGFVRVDFLWAFAQKQVKFHVRLLCLTG